ncbi:MAG: hypothetical protein ACREMB_05435 [Candidatus Rokuibacteriota bacterium]
MGLQCTSAVGVAEIVSWLARPAVDFPELTGVQLNPLLAGPGGVVAVDARATRATDRTAER